MPTYDQFRAMLPTHKHRLDDELEIHAQMQEQINTEVVTRNSHMLQTKDDLAIVEARLNEDYRLRSNGEGKVTVDTIAARVQRDPERTEAWQRYQTARAAHERWAGLLQAWRDKGFGIKTLADLYASQYFALRSHQRKERLPGRREEEQDQHRAEMRVAVNRPINSVPEPAHAMARRRVS